MKHPRRDQAFTCSRRQFLPALLQEMFVIAGAFKGRQGFRLSELGSLPDSQLAQIKPIVNPEYEIFMDQGHVCSRSRRTEATLKLFPIEKENLVVFNMFNGRHSLAEIGERLSQEMSWDEAKGFEHARDLFLSLISHLVCVPKDPLELDE
jgi:hypothetical protein